MLAIEMSVNIIWLPLIIIISAIAGFLLRSAQLNKSRKRILSLENEMLSNHAEILKLQEELVNLQKSQPAGNKLKVIPMKDPKQEDKKDNPDLPGRKSTIN